MMKQIQLVKGREKTVLRHHPWIFSKAVAASDVLPDAGENVAVFSADNEFLGTGAWSPASRIAVRMWNFGADAAEPDEAFFEKRIAAAYALRKAVFGGKLPDAYRLIHAESDGIPGFVCDIYGDYAVCQAGSAGAAANLPLLGKILLKYVRGVYERSDVDSRRYEGLAEKTGPLCGEELPDEIEFSENGVRYFAHPKTGHKTGFYLDQRLNRRAVMEAAAGCEEVLNCFCYTGGFGLAAAKGGAKHVLNVDCSASALELAKRNAALNGFAPEQFETLEADVFAYLRKCRDSRKSFDMIILDPPKFAGSESNVMKAARGYKDINLLAMKLLRPGGKLFTFSCSGAMTEDLFLKVVDSAASDAGADFRITARYSQGPDHPVSAAFPEGFYLKGLSGICNPA